jgi:hypothetical protein
MSFILILIIVLLAIVIIEGLVIWILAYMLKQKADKEIETYNGKAIKVSVLKNKYDKKKEVHNQETNDINNGDDFANFINKL